MTESELQAAKAYVDAIATLMGCEDDQTALDEICERIANHGVPDTLRWAASFLEELEEEA